MYVHGLERLFMFYLPLSDLYLITPVQQLLHFKNDKDENYTRLHEWRLENAFMVLKINEIGKTNSTGLLSASGTLRFLCPCPTQLKFAQTARDAGSKSKHSIPIHSISFHANSGSARNRQSGNDRVNIRSCYIYLLSVLRKVRHTHIALPVLLIGDSARFD
jgi:hypothetical protein